MPDDEGQFLDALYLGVRDGTEFDQVLALLCAMFDVASGALIDFDAARPDVAAQSAVGVFSGETARLYEREFAALDPAPPAFMSRPAGTAIPTYRLLPEERRRPGVFSASARIGRVPGRNAGGGEWQLCYGRPASRAGPQSLR